MGQPRTIVEEKPGNIAIMDVFSKLAQERIIFIDSHIDEELANGVIAQMLYLDSLSNDPISLYINSPGGSVYDGLAIYDVAEIIKSPVNTVCIGMAASMGAILMLIGKERSITKHARIMLHQPSGGAIGTVEDIKISYEQIEKLKKEMYEIVESKTSITNAEELFRNDVWYTAKEALEKGLVTKIL
jgi:ATP-dependent Clp protease protease subunit